jgi:hypothetical protein
MKVNFEKHIDWARNLLAKIDGVGGEQADRWKQSMRKSIEDHAEKEKIVWLLLYVDNDYNQPEKALEKVFWHEPTYEDLRQYGFTKEDVKNMSKPNRGGQTEYWIEVYQKINEDV